MRRRASAVRRVQRLVRLRRIGRVGGSLAIHGIAGVAIACTAAWAARGQAPDPQQGYLSNGAHRTHTTDGALHVAFACETCHPPGTAPAGPAQPPVTLPGFDARTKTCGGVYCHGGVDGGQHANAPRWIVADKQRPACGSCHALPPPTGAHAAHVSGAGLACSACHLDPAFPARHVDGTVDVVFNAPAASTTFDKAACTNAYCHSNARGVTHVVAWTGTLQGCAGCHDDETVDRPRMSGQHGVHFRAGVTCADCHGSVVDRKKTIVDSALHANGTADVRVLAGRYAAGSCFPACHDQRPW